MDSKPLQLANCPKAAWQVMFGSILIEDAEKIEPRRPASVSLTYLELESPFANVG